MERQQFITELKNNLIARGFSEDTVNSEMVTVRNYLEEIGMDDVEASVTEMADEIADMLKSQEEENADSSDNVNSADSGEKGQTEDVSGPVTAPEDIAAAVLIDDEIENALKEIGDERSASSSGKADEGKPEPAADNQSADDYFSDDDDGDMKVFSSSKKEKEAKEEPFEDDISYVDNDEDFSEFSPGGAKEKKTWPVITFFRNLFKKKKKGEEGGENVTAEPAGEYEDESSNNYDDKGRIDDFIEGYQNNKVLFWIVFAIALPIVIALSLFMVALYIAFWIALAVVMIGIVAVLILFVTAGVIITLVGLVYGAIQLIKGNTPVGMFEIGLAVVVGAVVMFVGILVYNVAIRLIPFLMKMLAKLLAFAFRKGKEGFITLKGVLDRI